MFRFLPHVMGFVLGLTIQQTLRLCLSLKVLIALVMLPTGGPHLTQNEKKCTVTYSIRPLRSQQGSVGSRWRKDKKNSLTESIKEPSRKRVAFGLLGERVSKS